MSTSFTGTSFGVEMRDKNGQYDLIIDGQRGFAPFVPGCLVPTNFTLASQLPDATHTFVMRRRTEPFGTQFGDSTTSLFSVFVDDGKTLLTTPRQPKPRKIEIIGDSIACGSGILGDNVNCTFSFGVQDYFSSFSALVAQHFKADINSMCWSGKGIVRNYNSSATACEICPDVMPAYFEHTLDSLDGDDWKFSTWKPDAVIINLGVNDYDPANPGTAPNASYFTAKYTEFVTDIRGKYYNDPNIHVFLVCRDAPVLGGPCALTKEVATGLVSTGHVHFVNITPAYEPASSLGCQGHPGLLGHRAMADLLIQSMASTLQWTGSSSTPDLGSVPIAASSAVLLAAFFLVGLVGHFWGCAVRKPSKGSDKGGLLLDQGDR